MAASYASNVQSSLAMQCRWFEAMEQKPSYLGTKSDFFTHVHDLPPQLGGNCFTFLSCSACLLACWPAGLCYAAWVHLVPRCIPLGACCTAPQDVGPDVNIPFKAACCMVVSSVKVVLPHVCRLYCIFALNAALTKPSCAQLQYASHFSMASFHAAA